MIALATRCHDCGQRLMLDGGYKGFAVHCPDCLDPEGDSASERLQGQGSNPEAALESWFERRVELALEPEVRLSALASFIVPKSPEGWQLTAGPGATYYGPAAAEKAVSE